MEKPTELTLRGCLIYWLWSDSLTKRQDVIPERITKIGGFIVALACLAAARLAHSTIIGFTGLFLLAMWWNGVQNLNSRKFIEYIKS